jgi:peptidyl-prolyl cis-trans isomerase C
MSITVNGVEIEDAAINAESAHHAIGAIPERRHRAAVALAIRELLRQRAVELALLAPAAEFDDGVIDHLLEREVAVPAPDEAACRRYYVQNEEQFVQRREALLRHILLAAHPRDADERERARASAERLIERLRDTPDRFADLAAAHSACPSHAHGGQLGWIGRGQTVPEFEDTVLRLAVGLAARPLETRYGWHVVEVLDRRAGEIPPFEAVQTQIARQLAAESKQRAIHQYLQLLAGQAEVRNLDLTGAATPLVQ